MGDSEEKIDDEVSFREIEEGIRKLQERDRARACKRLSSMFLQGEAGAETTKEISSAQPVEVKSNIQVKLDNEIEIKLPRFSGNAKLGSGEVPFHTWY